MSDKNAVATPPPYSSWNQPTSRLSLNAIILILGAASVLLSCVAGLGIVPGIAGLSCGWVAKRKAGRDGEPSPDRLRTIGLILAAVGIGFSLIYFAVVVLSMVYDIPWNTPGPSPSGVG